MYSTSAQIGADSAGTQLNRMLDRLGVSDEIGDLMGAALDAQIGDVDGMRRNLTDAFSGRSTASLDVQAMLSRALPGLGDILSPFGMLGMMGGSDLGANFAGRGSISSLLQGGPLGAVSGFLSRMLGGGMLGGILGGGAPQGGISSSGGATDASGAGGASAASGGSSPGGDEIGQILNDPSLSVEDKMAMVLMKLAENKEKELEAKLGEIQRAQGGGKSGAAGGAGGGGGLDIGGALEGAGIGFMAGGPIGALIGGVGGLMSGGGGSGGSGSGPSAAGGKQESEQILTQELQMIQEKMGRLLDTLSNLMKSFHQTSSNAIRNIN